MGKVLAKFTNGYAGAIARSLDDVVVALANKSNAALAFRVPVVLNSNKDGVIPFDPTSHTATDFIGVTVRQPSKTPGTYGSNEGSYAADDLVDVLVRGHIVVKCIPDGGTRGNICSRGPLHASGYRRNHIRGAWRGSFCRSPLILPPGARQKSTYPGRPV